MRSFLLLAFLTASLSAQLPINIVGQIWDGNGGPLLSGNVYHIISSGAGCGIGVPAGQMLTIEAGAIVKIGGCFNVGGVLNAIGTQSQQIEFTSIHDDTIGGDTNGNGNATFPAPGDWGQIDISGPGSTLDWCNFRYGGTSSLSALGLRLQTHVVRDCRFLHLVADGLSGATRATIQRCHFDDLGGIPVADLRMSNLGEFVDNTATDCDGGEYARIVSAQNFLGNLVMDHSLSINGNGVFVFAAANLSTNVPPGTQLTMPTGTVCKFVNGFMASSGRLIAQGTQAQPVVFTSIDDDTYGGDTRKDGAATQPAPGDWNGIDLSSGDDSDLQHCVIRYAGVGSNGQALRAHTSTAVIANTVIEHTNGNAIYVQVMASPPMEITDCVFQNNSLLPIRGIHWGELSKCRRNTAINNGAGNHFSVAPENINSTVVIEAGNFPGDVLEVHARTTVGAGGSFTMPAGTILKFTVSSSSGFSVANASAHLYLPGTARRPIVLTSFKDDSVGGDTNADGNASQPAPGDIQRITFGNNTATSVLENVVVRYGSGNSIDCSSANVALRSVRVDYSSGAGMRLSSAQGAVVNAVAYGCTGNGIELQNGSYDLLHATAAQNGDTGIKRTSLWSGQVVNSNAWANAAADIDVPAAQVMSSNGVGPVLAGANGNTDVDPQFVDAANGDLHLQVTSPCLGTADFGAALSVAKDHDETSRILDHALTGSLLPDMGAYELAAYSMDVGGEPVLGTTMTFTLQGPGGIGVVFISLTPSPGFLLAPFGVALLGVPNASLSGVLLMGQPANFALPANPGLEGVLFDIQGLGLEFSSGPLFGGFTNVDRNQLRLD